MLKKRGKAVLPIVVLTFPKIIVLNNQLLEVWIASQRLEDILKSLGRNVIAFYFKDLYLAMVSNESCELFRTLITYESIVENYPDVVFEMFELRQ